MNLNLNFIDNNIYLSGFYLSGKLAVVQNCIKIISDKSNSVAMFLRIQTDIHHYKIAWPRY